MNTPPRYHARFTIALILCLELAITATVAFTLWKCSLPLVEPSIASGLGQRYVAENSSANFPGLAGLSISGLFYKPPSMALDSGVPAGMTTGVLATVIPVVRTAWTAVRDYKPTLEPKAERAFRLQKKCGTSLVVGSLVGWLCLWLARRQHQGATCLCLSVYSTAAMFFRPWGLATEMYWLFAALFALIYMVVAGSDHQQTRYCTGIFNSYWAVLAWPGWCLFSGLGLLMVVDFGARGPAHNRYIGLHQADVWFAANVLLILSSVWRDRLLIGLAALMTLTSGLWQRQRGPYLLSGCALSAVLAIGWLGRSSHAILPGLGLPQVSGELIRALFGIATAWSLYRVGECTASKRRIVASLRRLGLLLLIILAGLVVSSDFGPLLVIGLALSISAITLLQAVFAKKRHWKPLTLILLVFGGCVLWLAALQELTPHISPLAAKRVAAVHSPFTAVSANLAQNAWLVAATPFAGFGLGRTPWCGAKAHIGVVSCTLGSGASIQLPSDYAAVGHVALWGLPAALALMFSLLLWWLVLLAPGLATWQTGRAPPWTLLQNQLVSVFVLLVVAQTLITVSGALGLIPLSGITLPLLGYGGTSLMLTALAVGLAMSPAERPVPRTVALTNRPEGQP